jgi:hypothetical protein
MTRGFLVFLSVLGFAWAQPEDPLQGLRKEHPRLIALDRDIERVRELIKENSEARRIYNRLVEGTSKLASAPPISYPMVIPEEVRVRTNPPILFVESRRCVERVFNFALLYRLDGKKEYLDLAVRDLRAAAAFPSWNPQHFLDDAEMSLAFAIGYDWLYSGLSPGDRALLRRAMVEKALDVALPIYERKPGWKEWGDWVETPFNWNQVCNAGITLAALAIAEDEPEKSRVVVRRALESIRIAMAGFNPDGGWKEGPMYWNYATRYNTYFVAGLETALGSDFGLGSLPGFSKTGRFRFDFLGPSGKTFNYADAPDRFGGAAQMFWMARRFSEPVYAWIQQQVLDSSAPGLPGGEPAEGTLDLLWYEPRVKSPEEAGWPLDSVYRGAEVAFLRSSWGDPNAIYVGVKGGDNQAGHAHLDLGSFVLDAGHVRWAIDLGGDSYALPGYSQRRGQRWTYYRTSSESHNTLLIDGENQDFKAQAAISAHRFGPEFSYVRVDLSQAYPAKLKRWERGIALADRRHVVVQDEITAPQPVEALWGMVTDAEVPQTGKTAELRKGDWMLSVRALSPPGAAFDVVSTTPPPPQNPNTGTRKLVVRLPGKVQELRLVVALTPHRAGQPAPVLSWKGRSLKEW